MTTTHIHKSGFVNIIGNPNVGKSSLLNALVGERLAAINQKAQTTRHRIFGIYNDPDYQIVFSDTPGVIKPAYLMQQTMMSYVHQALQDADVFLFMAALGERHFGDEAVLESLRHTTTPLVVAVNKVDLGDQPAVQRDLEYWSEQFPNAVHCLPLSVITGYNVPTLFEYIKELIPPGPEWFPKDQITDKSERFIVSEIIREKIMSNYRQEVPYAVQVEVESFKEDEKIIRIRAVIICERQSQKSIIIGKKGEMLKKVGMQARKDIEQFFGKQVFLETFVKVDKDWRDDERKLRKYGY
ncbi:MAG: GTPase Era [Salibacteraceae bacterium]